jgi:hypothetical protein
MRTLLGLSAFLAAAFLAGMAQAQDIPRIKARILDFDGKVLHVTSGTPGQSLSIGLMPATRVMSEEKRDAAAIKPGDYLGATLGKKDGKWQAVEIHLLPAELKGAGEGLYPLPSAPDRNIVTGVLTKNEAGALTVSFRGSVGQDGPTCTGRAPRQGGCKGEVQFTRAADAPVVALVPGNKSMLKAGKVVAVSVVAGPDGHLVTPGLTIENDTGETAGTGTDAPPPKPVK